MAQFKSIIIITGSSTASKLSMVEVIFIFWCRSFVESLVPGLYGPNHKNEEENAERNPMLLERKAKCGKER